MNLTKACAIFDNIECDRFKTEEKYEAIYTVCKMETHNSIFKDKMLKVIWWLLNQLVEIVEEDEVERDGH